MAGVVKCLLILVLLLVTTGVQAGAKQAVFHAKFIANVNELHVSIPNELIEPTIKQHYDYLSDRDLSAKETELYLEMYLRETVKLQYGAFPMALGQSGIKREEGVTKLVMQLAGIPKEARELVVRINSFANHPQQRNMFQLTKSYYKQSFALNNDNAFSANISL